jgi:hypothetical protein
MQLQQNDDANVLPNCPAEAIGREHAQLWRAFNLAEQRKLDLEADAIDERREHLEVQATYVQATSPNGALFQLGLASLWAERDDAAPEISRLIASAAKVLVSMGGVVVNEWLDPTTAISEGRAEAVIAEAAEPAQVSA